jgi:hypothetical protein
MGRLAPLLVLLLAVAAGAEESAGIECGLDAVVDPDDAAALAMYDGVRKGLELAHLPRVCRIEEPDPSWRQRVTAMGIAAAEDRRQGHPLRPVFAVGPVSVARFTDAPSADDVASIPLVFVTRFYTVGGRPFDELPKTRRSACAYAALSAEMVGRLVQRLVGEAKPAVELACGGDEAWPEGHAFRGRAARFLEAAGLVAAGPGTPARAVLHLQLSPANPAWSYERALARARASKVALVTDDRVRFGHGTVVTLVTNDALVGRVAAESARRMRMDPEQQVAPRMLPGFEVWVDLRAADEQGVDIPLPFLARADRIRPGRRVR